MHYCNPPVLHRDLKVENILILNADHYKLCDFGSAALSKGGYIPTTLHDVQKLEDDIQRHTTLQYRAPEMIDVYQKKPVNEKADIWALGVLLYKLCYYTTPFEEEGQLAILNARYTIPNSPLFSEGLRRLIISMLQEDQNRRPNIYQVMNAVCQIRGLECPIRDVSIFILVVCTSFGLFEFFSCRFTLNQSLLLNNNNTNKSNIIINNKITMQRVLQWIVVTRFSKKYLLPLKNYPKLHP